MILQWKRCNIVFKRNNYLSSIIRQGKKVGGDLRFVTGRTQEGGGVFQMRTVCNRGGGGGGLTIGKKCVCN